jgi:hypothetical protein
MANKQLYELKDYKQMFMNLQENVDLARHRVDDFKIDGIKKCAVEARALLMNIKKIAHILRQKLSSDYNNMPKEKRNFDKEKMAIASEKRKKTIAEKKKGKK